MALPASAAGAYGLGAPTESDLVALLSKTAGVDATAVVQQARRAAQVPPGPLSVDALEQVARAIVGAGQFPTTISARSFLVRVGTYRALAQKAAPRPATAAAR